MKKKDLILVIDMQNVYTEGQKWECLRMRERSERILAVLADERIAGEKPLAEVLFTRFLPPEAPRGAWRRYNEENKEVNEDAFANAMMPEFSDALRHWPLYSKSVYSSLAIPEVRAAAEAADRVIVTGVIAECCVLSTVTALIDAGIYVVWLSDAIAGLDEPKEAATDLILSGLDPLHLHRMTSEEYLTEK